MEEEKPPFDLRFKTGNWLIVAPSSSGKTTFLLNLLRQNQLLFKRPITSVLYFYKEEDHKFEQFKRMENVNVKFIKNAPEDFEEVKYLIQELPTDGGRALVFDDLATNLPPYLTTLFTVYSSHWGLDIFVLNQSLYNSKDPNFRILNLNAHYLVYFRTPRDLSQIKILTRQVAPSKSTILTRAIEMATSAPYSYILMDFTVDCSDSLRFRSNILPQEAPLKVYTI